MDLTLDLSVFMTSSDPGLNNIAKQIFGQLTYSSFYACLKVCKSWHGFLDPEWQVRRRKAMFEQVKPDFLSFKRMGQEKDFIEKLLDPNITMELSEANNNDVGWSLFLYAFRANNSKLLRFLLNHPNIETITFGRKTHYSNKCWMTQLITKTGLAWTEDTLKMILVHPKCQPFGYDKELGKPRFPFAFNSLLHCYLELKSVHVAKMMLQYPKLGPVDFSKTDNYKVGNALHQAITYCNVPMVELILDHCPQDILTSETGDGSNRHSPLHTAIDENRPDIVKILLDHRKFEPHFLVSLEMKHLVTPIQMAVKWNNLEIVKVILDHPKCDRSMLLSLDGCLIFGGKEVRKIVIEHPKMKSIRDFVKSVERYLK